MLGQFMPGDIMLGLLINVRSGWVILFQFSSG
jgi:hypothetical protein